eukprot:4631071-Pleurochrysis_carterae.AAC.2
MRVERYYVRRYGRRNTWRKEHVVCGRVAWEGTKEARAGGSGGIRTRWEDGQRAKGKGSVCLAIAGGHRRKRQ